MARGKRENSHDPLSGPEVAATIAREEQEAQEQPLLEPFKIVGQLVGARYNEAGEIVGEENMGELRIYKSQFGEVEQLIDRALQVARTKGT